MPRINGASASDRKCGREIRTVAGQPTTEDERNEVFRLVFRCFSGRARFSSIRTFPPAFPTSVLWSACHCLHSCHVELRRHSSRGAPVRAGMSAPSPGHRAMARYLPFETSPKLSLSEACRLFKPAGIGMCMRSARCYGSSRSDERRVKKERPRPIQVIETRVISTCGQPAAGL